MNLALDYSNKTTSMNVSSSPTEAPKQKRYRYTDTSVSFYNFVKMKILESDDGTVTPKQFEGIYGEWKAKSLEELTKSLMSCILTFGKYRGATAFSVIQSDPQYAKWLAFEVSCNAKQVAMLLERYFFLTGADPVRDIVPKDQHQKNYNGKKTSYYKGRNSSNRSYNRRDRSRSRSPRRSNYY